MSHVVVCSSLHALGIIDRWNLPKCKMHSGTFHQLSFGYGASPNSSLRALHRPTLPLALGSERGHALFHSRSPSPNSKLSWRSTSRNLTRFEVRSAGDGYSEMDVFLLPDSWTEPDTASEESEWLRVNLKQWLDDEFCPEPANEGISSLCARAYERCLLQKQLDLGEILLQMVDELSDFSFKESFHGAFSSANAAADLIAKRALSTR